MTRSKRQKPWEHLSTGKRSAMSILWNKFRDITEVSKRADIEPEIVMAYLQSRPGYPGEVLRHHDRKYKPKPTKEDMGISARGAPPIKTPVTLPKVRILEKQFDWLEGL